MKGLYILLTSAVVTGLLVGCPGDNGQGNVPAASAPPPVSAPPSTPPAVGPGTPVTTAAFSSFVQQLLASTAENTDPTPIETVVFSDQLSAGDPQPISFFRP